MNQQGFQRNQPMQQQVQQQLIMQRQQQQQQMAVKQAQAAANFQRQQQQQRLQAQAQAQAQAIQIQRQQSMSKVTQLDERCKAHGEVIVGYIQENQRMVCNICIYQEKLEKIKFIALVSKELNYKFQHAFNEYKDSISKLDQVDPNLVKQKFQTIVREFFQQLSQRVASLQDGVMVKIKNSDSLKQLEKILEGSKEYFSVSNSIQQMGGIDGNVKQDQFEKEKLLFDQKIQKGRFASVVKRQEFYKSLLESLDSNCVKMKQTIDLSTQQIQRVLKLQSNESYINEQLAIIVNECIDIDLDQPVNAPPSVRSGSPSSVQSVQSNQQQQQNLLNQQRQQQQEQIKQKMFAQQQQIQIQQQKYQEIMRQKEQEKLESEKQQEVERQKQIVEQKEIQSKQQQQQQQFDNQGVYTNAQQDSPLSIHSHHSQSNNSQNESSEPSNHSNSNITNSHQSNSDQGSPSKLQTNAQDIVELAQPPQPPSMMKPEQPQFTVPQCPPNLPDSQKEQFKLFLQMRYKQYQEKMGEYRDQLTQWQEQQDKYSQDIDVYNERKAQIDASKCVQQKDQQEDQVMVIEKPAPQPSSDSEHQHGCAVHCPSSNQPTDVQITKVNDVIDVDQQMKEQEDDIQELTPPQLLEHTYKTSFKLKSMKLLQLIPGQGWNHVIDVKDLFMAKIAYNPHCNKVYVIGGARDAKSKHTVNNVNLVQFTPNGFQRYEVAPMTDPRASFGCLYNPRGGDEILVAGGYINGKLSTKCEKYIVPENRWVQMPDLNEAKASSSLCLLNERYLYCFGGLSRNQQGQAYLTNSIEVLDLANREGKWEKLNLLLPVTGCDIGCLPIKSDEVLVFGGWNKNAQKGVFVLHRKSNPTNASVINFVGNNYSSMSGISHEIRVLGGNGLDQADFFLVNGIAMNIPQDERKVRLCGHSCIFQFDLDQAQFEGSSQI